MERVAFLIEETNVRISCMLNPESFEIQRTVGVSRSSSGQLINGDLSDDPVLYTGRGDTELTLELLFDVALAGSTIRTDDVRELTAPLWQLAEYKTARHQYQELPQVRFIWGKSWNIPVVVASVAERYERFTQAGVAQRSWLKIRLLRVSEGVPPVRSTPHSPTAMPDPDSLEPDAPSWGVHEFLGGGMVGETLPQLAGRYYGDPELWRLIAIANDIDDPATIPAGTILQIPPLTVLRGAA